MALSQSRKGELVHVDTIADGRKIYLKMTGKKSLYDFTVHAESEHRWVSYYHDYIMDIVEKRKVQPLIIPSLIEALEESVELRPIAEIYEKYSELTPSNASHLPGHTIDYLLKMIRWLGLQEDVNYWGPQYAGRMKPIMALREHFIKGTKLEDVMKTHKIHS